jgi:hypothetical protein
VAKVLLLGTGDKGYRVTCGLGSPGAAYAMNVVFRIDRHIEVDDVRDSLDIDSSCGDIGCHHDAVFTFFEALERPQSLSLGAAGVYRH